MVRPCYLVIDREYSASISTRKLVIETAKFNVITAYSAKEAMETLRKYPAVDGIVLDAAVRDMPCHEVVSALKEISVSTPIVLVGLPRTEHCPGTDYTVESFQPGKLLELLQSLKPEQTEAVQKRNEELLKSGS